MQTYRTTKAGTVNCAENLQSIIRCWRDLDSKINLQESSNQEDFIEKIRYIGKKKMITVFLQSSSMCRRVALEEEKSNCEFLGVIWRDVGQELHLGHQFVSRQQPGENNEICLLHNKNKVKLPFAASTNLLHQQIKPFSFQIF